jgi:hypothetical protein
MEKRLRIMPGGAWQSGFLRVFRDLVCPDREQQKICKGVIDDRAVIPEITAMPFSVCGVFRQNEARRLSVPTLRASLLPDGTSAGRAQIAST